ncbi:long-chain fatty acid--CoA ligase, partial [bacterium]
MDKPWLQHYPAGIPHELPELPYHSIAELLTESFARFGDRPLLEFMGTSMTYRAVDEASKAFAAYLQALGLEKGDRVALMMPNVPQYPIAVAGVV